MGRGIERADLGRLNMSKNTKLRDQIMALELGVIAIEHHAPKFPADELNHLRELAEDLRKTHDDRKRAGGISRGGGRPLESNPSKAALYQRERRRNSKISGVKLWKAGKRLKKTATNTDDGETRKQYND